MDNSLRSAALHALVGAEIEAREKALPQLDEAKTILYEFVRVHGHLSVPGEVQENATLVEAVRMAVDVAAHQINQLRAELAKQTRGGELAMLIAENARLREQLQAAGQKVPAVLTPQEAAQPPEQVRVANSIVEPALVQAEAAPIVEGSLEERFLSLAGAMQGMRVPALIDQCVEQMGVDRAGAEAGLKILVSSGSMTIHEANRLTRNGGKYAAVFCITGQGLEVLGKMEREDLVNSFQRLSVTEQIWPEEMPLLAYFVEEVLPRHGYSLAQYTPEVVFNGASGTHTLTAHALLSLSETPVYLMYLGEKYKKGDINSYYTDLHRLTNGELYFLCLNRKTVRTLESDVAFLASGNTGIKAHLHIANIDDLALYDEQVGWGFIQASADSIWFGTIRSQK